MISIRALSMFFCAILIFAVFAVPAKVMPWDTNLSDNHDYPTGLEEMTEEEMEEFHKDVPWIYDTMPTQLGADRMARAQKDGQFEGEVVPFGKDLLTNNHNGQDYRGEPRGTRGNGSALPSSVDNSLLQAFPPIRSQGSLSSCVPFSILYYQLTHEVGLREGWNNKNDDNTIKFSPKWGYNFINDGNNGYTNWGEAYNVVKKHGAVKWSEFPYDNDYREWCLDTQAWRDALDFRVETVNKFFLDSPENLELLKEILNNGHITVFGSFISSWVYLPVKDNPMTAEDDGFVGETACYDLDGTSGSHSMTIVGYNDNIWVDTNNNDVVESNELGALKIANSYGPNWKNDGFAWLIYDAALNVSGAVRFVYSITLRETEPELLAEFTVNHAQRDQLYMSLGISDITKNVPSDYWDPEVLTGDGGPYAFDGSSTSCNGTFVLDFTELFQTITGEKKYYLRMEDNSNDGNVAEVSAYRLHHLPTGETVEYQGPLPETVDNNHVLLAINFEPGDNIFPVADISTTPDPPLGTVPLEVQFSGYGSVDSDGEIVSYEWDFGDGSYGTGMNVSHTYTTEGEYVVTLVVTDDNNATDSETCTVTVKPHLPEPPEDLGAELAGQNLVDVRLTWTASSDDGEGDFSVVSYTIYRSTTGVNGLYEPVDTVPAQGIPTKIYEWTDYGEGDGDPNSYFYIVRASDVSGKEDQDQNRVGKFVSVLDEGWNLISIPLVQKFTEMEYVLQTISGNYASVQGYHSGELEPWIHWHGNKPNQLNHDLVLDHRGGYYINMIVTDNLVIAGKVAPSTEISLKTGWNLIGYPCLREQRVDSALSSLDRNYDRVEKYDTALDNEVKLLSSDLMVPGLGYWIHATQDRVLTITN